MSELWNKETKVLTIKDIDGVPSEIVKIDAWELLPICLKKECSMKTLNEWFSKRNIPYNREGLNEIKEEFGEDWLVNKNYASLSDQFWLKKRTETWRKINFFTNKYTNIVGTMAFEPWTIKGTVRLTTGSPDLTTNGILKKRWIQNADNTSMLVKAASKQTKQEPLNEVLVSVLAEQLNIPCVKYDLRIEGIEMCSVCNNFITEDTELVPASHIYFYEERKEGETVYSHLLKMCELFDIPDAEPFLRKLIFLDSITGNEDRNLNNIGFIRDVKTGNFIGPAPVFDCGNAYWNTKSVNNAVKSKFFNDVEDKIVKEELKKMDLSVLKSDYGFKRIIYDYPGITSIKKSNLIEAISLRNARLLNEIKLNEANIIR